MQTTPTKKEFVNIFLKKKEKIRRISGFVCPKRYTLRQLKKKNRVKLSILSDIDVINGRESY